MQKQYNTVLAQLYHQMSFTDLSFYSDPRRGGICPVCELTEAVGDPGILDTVGDSIAFSPVAFPLLSIFAQPFTRRCLCKEN